MSWSGYDVAFDVITLVPPAMPASRQLSDWDIFCNVIDNYGDIGVCWRLARQLASEHGIRVRLWVDELNAFQRICPEIDPSLSLQAVRGVEVLRWDAEFVSLPPGGVVIESFACKLPERFIEAMAKREPRPVWINLDYLSAEAWVSGCHGLPSPHPQYPLTKYFFFPGFDETTGGLLREHDLELRREAFEASAEHRSAYWRLIGQTPPSRASLLISLFSYDNPNIRKLLTCWAESESPICCLLPATRSPPAIEAFVGHPLLPGETARHGRLELRILPFVPQADYDFLLWLCDINFVRGEDSFVRAQWAARPLIWQIYPQDEGAHLIKLSAFLDRYCAELTDVEAKALRNLFVAWNEGTLTRAVWTDWLAALPAYRRHAKKWEKHLRNQEDLCTSLVRFCRSKL